MASQLLLGLEIRNVNCVIIISTLLLTKIKWNLTMNVSRFLPAGLSKKVLQKMSLEQT